MTRRKLLASILAAGVLKHLPIAKAGDVRPEALRPGDYIVYETPDNLGIATYAQISEDLRKLFPDNEVIIVTGGTLKALRKE